MKRKISILLVMVMIFALVLSGCGEKATEEPSNGNEGTENEQVENQEPARDDLIVALDVSISSLDPLAIMGVGSMYVNKNIYDTLVELDENLEPVPSLAESWTISDDSLTYTFKLREDVKFSNGEDFTADDVVFTFDRLFESSIGVFYSQYISNATKIDEYTVEVKTPVVFEGIYVALSQLLAIVPKDYVESAGDAFATEPVGSGPFVIKEFVPGSHVELERNENYFGGVSNIKKLTMKFIPDPSTRSIALESGEVDFIIMPSPEDRDNLMSLDNVKYDEVLSNLRYHISLTTFKNLQDTKLREAITYVINSEEIFQAVTGGIGQMIPGTLSPAAFPDYYNLVQYCEYDVEKAKAALTESNYEEGTVINITITDPSTSKLIAEVIQNQLSQVGISTNIEIIELGTYYARMGQGDIEIAVELGGSAVYGPQEEIGGITTMQDYSMRYPDSEELDNLYIELTQTADKAERVEIIKQAYELIKDMYIFVPLYATNYAVAYNKDLKDVTVVPDSFNKFSEVSW